VKGVLGTRRLDCVIVVQHALPPDSRTPAPPAGSSRLGWYSGPVLAGPAERAGVGAIDFLVARAGAGKVVRKLQFGSRITCTRGVTSHHVHVDGSFPVRVAGGKETFSGRASSVDLGAPLGRVGATFAISGEFAATGGPPRFAGTLRLTHAHEALGACDTGTVRWEAPAAAKPTHEHP
jgi:hypothetical protein